MTEIAVAGALLAGGRSTRFGSDKLQACFPGSTERLVDRAARALSASGCEPLAWVSPQGGPGPGPEWEHLADSGEGPLGALALALRWAQSRHASRLVVVAGDLPLLRGQHLATLIAEARQRGSDRAYCALGPDGRCEPLCAVYPVDWASEAQDRFARGLRAARAVWLCEPRGVQLVPSEQGSSVSSPESSPEVTVSVTVRDDRRDTIHPCFNLNDQEDWEQLQRWSKKGELP